MIKTSFEVEFKVVCGECQAELEADLVEGILYVYPCPNKCKDSSLIEDEEE